MDGFVFLLVLVVPCCCSQAAHLKHALWWVPIVGALLTAALTYGALSLSSEPMWAPVAGLLALFWGYVLCFVFTLIGFFMAHDKSLVPR